MKSWIPELTISNSPSAVPLPTLPLPVRSAARYNTGRRWKKRFSLALALGAIGLPLYQNWWSNTAYAQLQRTAAAMSVVKTLHQTYWRVKPDGSRVKSEEFWYRGGRTRHDLRWQQEIYAQGKIWQYRPYEDRVISWKPLRTPFDAAKPSLSLTEMRNAANEPGSPSELRTVRRETLQGRPVKVILHTTYGNDLQRDFIWVDEETDLPITAEYQIRKDYQKEREWITEGSHVFRFNETLPETLFDPQAFSKTARFFSMEKESAKWTQRLSQGKGFARSGDLSIVLRDVQVNEEGDVFLLFTDGRMRYVRRDLWVEIKDDLGNRYLSGPNYGTGSPEGKPRVEYAYGEGTEKGSLKRDWWIPVSPQFPWRPRRMSFSFYLLDQPHFGEDAPALDHYRAKTTLTLSVPEPTAKALPEWMPLLYGESPWLPWRLPMERAKVRARYYLSQGEDEAALAQYRERVRLRREEKRFYGNEVNDSEEWSGLGEGLMEKPGRESVAAHLFEEALRSARTAEDRKRAEDGLKRLNRR